MEKIKRVVIITGGGTGIGAATARGFAAIETAVAIVGRRIQPLEQVANEICSKGGEAISISADLEETSAPAEIVQKVIRKWGQIDVIVNNAGIVNHKPIEQATVEFFNQHIAVNVRAPYFLIQAALPYLRKSSSASIINISSSSASLAIPGQSMYGISKSALEYLTKSLAAELAPNIRVNCIAPGPIDTPIHLKWAGNDVAGAYRRMTKELPLKRMGKAKEVAAWIIWLASSKAFFVTGTVIPVDGGQTLPGALSRITL